MSNVAKLKEPFQPEELRHFEGRGGKTMTFIEDETVMDRLDLAFGIGGWQIQTEAVPLYEGVVKVRLGVRVDSEWTWYEDFGYPNQAGGDVLKEAVSDGIRRCGRYLGIARDLYRKRTYEAPRPPQTAQVPRPAPNRPTAPPPVQPPAEDDFDWSVVAEALGEDGGTCSVHGVPWVLKPAGVSKNGSPYDAFYSCGVSGPPWCKEKPAKAWVESHHP